MFVALGMFHMWLLPRRPKIVGFVARARFVTGFISKHCVFQIEALGSLHMSVLSKRPKHMEEGKRCILMKQYTHINLIFVLFFF